ncbi:MAG: 4Fe-4S binding protein [Thiogranum sp.]|nr:4Fe-4S binding protein [Thiogranum sp.]
MLAGINSDHLSPESHGLWFAGLLCLLLVFLLPAAHAADENLVQKYPDARAFFPDADQFGGFDGDPLAAPVIRNGETIGYLFVTADIAPIPAYSGKPVNMLSGIDMEGRIVGVTVLEHHEPILLVGIPESSLRDFVRQYIGKPVTGHIKVGAGSREGYTNVDAITGATVTVMVMNETLLRAARKVAVSRGIIEPPRRSVTPPATVRMDVFQEHDWKFLTGNGAIRRMHLTRGEVDSAFEGSAAEGIGEAPRDAANETFINLYYGYLNTPTIGRNLLGESQYNWLMSELEPGEHAIAVMANGIYSFKGSGYVRGGIFDRIQVMQGDVEIPFRDLDYYRLSDVYTEGTPDFSEMGIFVIRENYQFDPGSPWSINLLVKRDVGPLESAFVSFDSSYEIPESYVERPEPVPVAAEDEPMWVAVWLESKFQIAVLVAGLTLLVVILAFQDILVRYPRLTITLRRAFAVYTLFFIGWYMLGQLSIVNVFVFTNSIFSGDFRWETFMIDPTIFILWVFVAASLLFWGRGVYCGWLCPFGALQKLVNEIARAFKVRQFNLPQVVHDRLWGIKYIILLVLFGISLQSLGTAERYAEVEPFKTAITLRFDREAIFVAYALGLVLISIFNCKFYCKYLCPLGAALGVPARLRMVNWLRRRRECGNPCQICAKECEIQAIHETGEININECHYCLDCQVTYWDDHKCPPLVERRKKHERVAERARKVEARKTAGGLDNIAVEVVPKSGGSVKP